MKKTSLLLLGTIISSSACTTNNQHKESNINSYKTTNFVANKKKYSPTLAVEKNFENAWGIAIRPKGSGGHFWITAKDISYEYVGDVKASTDKKLNTLHTDALKYVHIPTGGKDKFSTSTVFSGSKENFVITQKLKNGELIKAPTKFFFSSDGGIISAWTEHKKPDGSFDWPEKAISVIDHSKQGAQFFGIAINADYSRLYAADFGVNPGIKVFDGKFQQITVNFDQPFDSNKNGKVDSGEYAPFNIQALKTPAGQNHIFVTYAKTQTCPAEEIKKDACKAGEIFAGEEDTSEPGAGRLAEFTEDGKLIAVWKDGGNLSAPWGLAFAPQNFGKLSNTLLVANFGEGTIAAFNPRTHELVDYIRNEKGETLRIDKIWGLLFGNGESLGDSNALYFTAGPDDEKDGIFGSIRASSRK
jgi:uncharacterized protein (TIGR03118 family)